MMCRLEQVKVMKAAFGRVSITPPINGTFPDFFFQIEGVLDEIYARVAILDAGSLPVVIVALDVLGVGVAEMIDLETALSEKVGISPERIWITGSHSHSAPILCPIDLYGGFSPYLIGLKTRLVNLVVDLLQKLKPISIQFGRSTCNFNVNRRRIDENGNCSMAPNPDGIVDKSVPVISCRNEDGILVGVFFSYCCHPTILLGPKISGDYPGWAQLLLEKEYDSTVALFLPGVFGNIRPHLEGGDSFRLGTESDVISCGQKLAEAVQDGMQNCRDLSIDAIYAWRSKPQLPIDKPLSNDELDYIATQSIESQRKNDISRSWRDSFHIAQRQWVQQVRLENAEGHRPSYHTYTFSRLQLGELNWVGLSGEFFLEYGTYVQQLGGSETTLAFGYTQGCQTYVPTAEALMQGGYEVEAYKRWKQSAPFKPEVEEVVKEAIADLINSRP